MDDIWSVIADLAADMHPDRIDAVAKALMGLTSVEEFDKSRQTFGTNIDQGRIDDLKSVWMENALISPAEVSAGLKVASAISTKGEDGESIELVWTGPKTDLIPTRRTEQVMMGVIESAEEDIFLVTYVFYRAPSIIEGLNDAIERGVQVSILMETSLDGGIDSDSYSLKSMNESVPGADIFLWDKESAANPGEFSSGKVHAKCTIADSKVAFITSANLTSAAMERNMEVGVLVRGGNLPGRLSKHLRALTYTRVLKLWDPK